jgi:uncharacterized membrane protein (DUF485 family)
MELHEQTTAEHHSLDYEKICASSEFQELLAAKKKFIIFTTVFFLGFALLLPVFAFYTNWLTKPFYGSISWAWLFAFAQFVMTWIICGLYVKKAAVFDEMAAQVLNQAEEGRS